MPSQPENFFQFEKLLAELARAGVDFAVVGGVAVSLNGFVRATDDVDIVVKVAPDNIGKMLACLRGWGEGWAREFRPEDFVPREGLLRLMEEFDLDIFTQMRGKSLDDFRPRLCVTWRPAASASPTFRPRICCSSRQVHGARRTRLTWRR